MASEAECYVYLVPPGETAFVTAGRFRLQLTREGHTVGEFLYGRRYRERPGAVELDPVELRLAAGTFRTARGGGLFGAIRDAMPDAWGRRVIERHVGGTLTDLDYLLRGPDDRAGALGFGTGPEPPAPRNRFNQTLDLVRLQAAADAILDDEPETTGSAGTQAEDLLLLGGTSLGGARPKAAVEDGGALWIAKFSRPDDRFNQPRVEHAMLNLARKVGINAAESRLTAVGGRDVLLVRRFDRDRTDDGYQRHRMVSAATLLGVDDEVTNRATWSYLLLADEIRRTSAKPEEDLRELFRRMCFNAAISNLDDHPRNHALLARSREWRLSPAYDLMPMPVVARDRRDLALVCGHEGRGATRGNLLSGCGRFLLGKADAERVLDEVLGTVEQGWVEEVRMAGVGRTDVERLGGAMLYPGLAASDNP